MSHVRSLLYLFVTFLLMFPAVAAAADDEPKTTIVIIDSDPGDKGRAFKPLDKALSGRKDVKVTSEAEFLESAKERGVTLETLRKGSAREKNEEPIANAMADAGIEVLIVVDAIKKRRYAQAVVLGPKGKELADIRERISRIRKTSGANKHVLNKAIKAAQPEVAAHREMLRKKAEAERLAAAKADEKTAKAASAEDAEVAASMEVAQEQPESTGEPFMMLSVAGLLGQRSFSAEAAESSYAIDHSVPLAGATMELGLTLARFGNGLIGFEAQGDYAPMSVEFVADGGEPFTVSGHHVAGRGELVYRHRFGAAFTRIGFGADAVSSTLDPNSYFTGTRYIAGRGTIGAGFGDVNGFMVELNGGVLPVFSNNTSGQAYGEAPLALAYTGQGRIRLAFTSAIGMQLGYDLRLYSNTYEEPPLASSAVEASDLIHGGNIGLTIRL